jgi:hypothetical protein
VDKIELANKLEQFRNKACCEHTQRKATSIFNEIKDSLTQQQYIDIVDAWNESRMDSNKERPFFHETINDIINELRS